MKEGHITHWYNVTSRRLSVSVLSIFLAVLACVVPVLPSAADQDKTGHKNANDQLIAAAQENDAAKMKLALENGADINTRTESGQTALHIVQDPHLAKLLIEKGADVNLKDYDFEMTPIYYHGIAIAKLLHKARADINAKAKKGITPLMWYCYGNYLDGVKFLIANGAQINVVNQEESTALDIAKRFHHAELAEYLVSVGAKSARDLNK